MDEVTKEATTVGTGSKCSPGPLRVLHITATNQRRGAEVFAADLIGALPDVEHQVGFLRPVHGGLEFPCASRPLSAGSGPAGLVTAGRALRSLVAAFQPDVLQAHGGEALRLAVLAGVGRTTPVVYRRIGMAPRTMRDGWRLRWHRWLMGRCATIVCVADAVRAESLERFGLDPQRTLTIPNAVAPARLATDADTVSAVRASLGLAPEALVVLSIGALSWEKDPLGALDVTADLLGVDNRLTHVFAGDGPLRPALEARIRELGLLGRVMLAGSRSDVGAVLAACDVMLFASRPDGMEGMPATLIEAGLAGRPVVAFDVAGVAEVVEDGVSGVVVPPQEPARLRSALDALLNDPRRRRSLGEAAALRCAGAFTIDVVAPRYQQVWERSAQDRRR